MKTQLLGLALLLLIVAGGLTVYFLRQAETQSAGAAQPAAGNTIRITYRVTGTVGNITATWINATGSTSQRTTTLPWQTTVEMAKGKPASFVVQNQGASGAFMAEILQDGRAWKDGSSNAAYGIVSLAGLVGSK